MRMIDADALIGLAHKMQFGRILTDREVDVVEMVVNSVSDDARVDLVRCRDCIYYEDADFNIFTEHDRVCAYVIRHHFYREPDEYCSKGKRKGGDK